MIDCDGVLVLADLMLDLRTFGTTERLVPDAPAIVFATESDGGDEVRLGGGAAGNNPRIRIANSCGADGT